MADVLNRTSMVYLQSVNTPDYPDTDWIINPDLSQTTLSLPYWVINVDDTVRDMTADEISAYNSAHPPTVNPYNLADGTPSYMDADANIPVSIERTTVTFSSQTVSGKKFYLDYNGVSSITNGWFAHKNAIIKTITVSLKMACSADITIYLKDTATQSVVAQFGLQAGNKTAIFDKLTTLINSGQSISCYVESQLIQDPVVNMSVAWRN